jgi:hypothetical protein
VSITVTIIFAGTATAFWNKGNKKSSEKKTETFVKKEIDSQSRDENKLLQLDSLEESFLKGDSRRKMLAVAVLNLQSKLEQVDNEKEKKDITEQIDQAHKELQDLNVAMGIVFSPLQPWQYEYNPVRSTVYIKVGNIEEVFIRAVQLRDTLLRGIQEKQKQLDEAKDDEKKEIQMGLDKAQRQYQMVVASLQLVFDIIPQRNYLYNPKDSTLYLKVTEDEAEKIQEKINEIRKKSEEPK